MSELVVEGPVRDGGWRGDADLAQLAGPVDGLVETGDALRRGDFLEAGLDLAGTGMSALGFMSDPLAGLFSAGIGWLVDHVEPMPTWLDQLAGDPDRIEAFSATWSNVADRIHDTADDYGGAARSASVDWSGLTTTAYVGAAELGGQAIHGLGHGVSGVAVSMELAGAAVGYVRGLIRDTVVDLVAFALARVAEFLTVVGAGPAVARFAARAIGDTNRMRRRLDELLKTIDRLNQRLGMLLGHLDDLGRRAQAWSSRVGVDKWDRVAGTAVPILQAIAEEDDDGPSTVTV